MSFHSDLIHLGAKVAERKPHIVNEEMTKQSLIIPLLQQLGYDVFDPLEVRPEYVADFSFKKGEKVDYAIFQDGSPIIFIEAKAATEDLGKHSGQLARYFNATPEVKVGILTNGVEYKFYTDLTQDNIMDYDPFFSFQMESISHQEIETLEQFTKENFDSERIVNYAEELSYMSHLDKTLKELVTNPSDEFLRFLIKDFINIRITSAVLDRFRPLVKKAVHNTLLDLIREGLDAKEFKELKELQVAVSTEPTTEPSPKSGTSQKKGIVTTEEELMSFELVKGALMRTSRDISELQYKDTMSYFTIYNETITKWLFRLKLDGSNPCIITRLPMETCIELCPGFTVEPAPKSIGETRIRIEDLMQISQLTELITTCYDNTL
ncbi:type I restriction endonuclease [Hazenella coriacea]|uniref:Restriction endonuclease type I HsdR N-terminal domain-containing protein n=1 Tax=Hazenella coriacea TaxID=1179467 RepID=A0A4R3L7A2_9BACL|nr:type I restriction endonuclease [Hazenella coriacea]TCS94820.1 hypothetical protein EDD58_103242 [Hazenella coriacea]